MTDRNGTINGPCLMAVHQSRIFSASSGEAPSRLMCAYFSTVGGSVVVANAGTAIARNKQAAQRMLRNFLNIFILMSLLSIFAPVDRYLLDVLSTDGLTAFWSIGKAVSRQITTPLDSLQSLLLIRVVLAHLCPKLG